MQDNPPTTDPLPSISADVDRRLIALEERQAFMEHTLESLGQALTATRAQLDRLECEASKTGALVERLSSLGLGDDLPHEKPPHY